MAIPDAPKGEIRFHYLKSPSFRTYHADGASVAGTPSGGGVVVVFYAERWPIPTETVHALLDGTVAEEKSKTVRAGIVRDMQCNVVLDLDTARSVRDLLNRQIQALEGAESDADQGEEE